MLRRIGKNGRSDESHVCTCAILHNHHPTQGPHSHRPVATSSAWAPWTSPPPHNHQPELTLGLPVPSTISSPSMRVVAARNQVQAVVVRTRFQAVAVRTCLSLAGGHVDFTMCQHTSYPGYKHAAELLFLSIHREKHCLRQKRSQECL